MMSVFGRSAVGAGIGKTLIEGKVSRCFIGVTEARHASKVVCLELPGDDARGATR